jgi:hypothetical protein
MQPLRVDLPSVRDANEYSAVTEPSIPPFDTSRHQPAVVGSKSSTGVQSKIKVSPVPRAFHLYIGNLDVNMESSGVSSYLEDSGINVLACEIIKTSRNRDYN